MPHSQTRGPQVMSISTLAGFPASAAQQQQQTVSPYSPIRPLQGSATSAQTHGSGYGPASPWSAGPFSATSQDTPTGRSDFRPRGMAWPAGMDPQQRQQQQQPSQHSHPQTAFAQQHPRQYQQNNQRYQVQELRMPPIPPNIGQSSQNATWSERQNQQGPLQPGHAASDEPMANKLPEMDVPASTWTRVTSDSGLVRHLLALYFCWEYPTFASLSKEHFLEDFRQGRHRYCSPILVNALLALGCRFSSRPNTRVRPEDPSTSGDHFFEECQRLFYEEEDHHSLTTIQALGIMSIREASSGRDSESWYYAGQSIRLAIEMGLHRVQDTGNDDEDELAVQSATFWGAFALDHAWSLATGSLPQCSVVPHLPPKPGIIQDIEASLWVPYTDDGTPLQRSCEQPSNVRSVYKCFCELSELVHQSLYILHSPGRPLTSRDLLSIYTQYLNWYDKIPEVLRLGHNFTPAVLFAHMYYHFAILLLFRPLIKLRIIGSSIAPRDVCCQAADAIQSLLKSYSQLYTLRRTPSFVPYFVLTSSITHLAIGASTPLSASTSSTATPASMPLPSADMAAAGIGLGGGGNQPSPGDQQQQQGRPPGQTQQNRQQQQQQQQPATTRSPSQQASDQVRLPPNVVEAITRGIADLTEMAPCHHFAVQALNILRYLAKKWNIPVNLDEISKRAQEGGQGEGKGLDGGRGQNLQEQKDIERAVRPVTSSRNFFAPSVQETDFLCAWGPNAQTAASGAAGRGESDSDRGSSDPNAEAAAKKADALDNPLFWPFPMQGRPMLPMRPQLEEAGFALL
jgi:hypothetical protein